MANARSGDASGMDHHPVPPALGRRVAHRRQFGTPIDRAHIGRAKLKAKLCSPNLDDWRIPPKPPKMRWATYDRLIEQYLKYDAVLGGVPIQQISNA